jgi:hypothetical protein
MMGVRTTTMKVMKAATLQKEALAFGLFIYFHAYR